MALYPKRLKGGRISVLIGDGGAPETFTKICGATQKSFTYQKNTTDDFLDDCSDPDAIPVRTLQSTGRQWDISINAWYNRTQAPLIRELLETSEPRNMRFEFTEPGTEDVDAGVWEGPGQITNFQVTGEGNTVYATATIAIASDGEWTWTDA